MAIRSIPLKKTAYQFYTQRFSAFFRLRHDYYPVLLFGTGMCADFIIFIANKLNF
jgi:hypothetical protein